MTGTASRSRVGHLRELARNAIATHLDPHASTTLQEAFRAALSSDADVVVLMARRAIILFRLFCLAGYFSPSLADLSGRVITQRRAEREVEEARQKGVPSALEGAHVAVVDDWIQTGETVQKYVSRFDKAGAMSIHVYAAGRSKEAVKQISDMETKGTGFSVVDPDNSVVRSEVGVGISAATLDSSLFYFVDFPIFRVTPHAMTLAVFLNWLTFNGWTIAQLHSATEGSLVRHFVIREKGDGSNGDFRLRLQLVLDDEGEIVDAQFLAKVSVPSSPQPSTSVEELVADELVFRKSLYFEALSRFAQLFSRTPALSDALAAEFDDQALADNWTDREQREIRREWRLALRNSAIDQVDEALAVEIATFLSNQDEVAVFRSRIAARPSEALLDHLRGVLGRHMDGLEMHALIEACSAHGDRTSLLEAFDQLHDESFIVSRLRVVDGNIARLWFLGENSSEDELAGVEGSDSYVLDGRVYLNGLSDDAKQHFTTVPANEVGQVLTGQMIAFAAEDNDWLAIEGQFDDDTGEHFMVVARTLPPSVLYSPRLHDWFEARRPILGDSNVYSLLETGDIDSAYRLVAALSS